MSARSCSRRYSRLPGLTRVAEKPLPPPRSYAPPLSCFCRCCRSSACAPGSRFSAPKFCSPLYPRRRIWKCTFRCSSIARDASSKRCSSAFRRRAEAPSWPCTSRARKLSSNSGESLLCGCPGRWRRWSPPPTGASPPAASRSRPRLACGSRPERTSSCGAPRPPPPPRAGRPPVSPPPRRASSVRPRPGTLLLGGVGQGAWGGAAGCGAADRGRGAPSGSRA